MENYDDAYIVTRSRRGGGRGRGGAAIFVAALILLTAAICLLAVFLPRAKSSETSTASVRPKTFYFLATAETDSLDAAMLAAQDTAARGGAGYIYNDGKYKIVAAVYANEYDAKMLAAVNADSYCFALEMPTGASDSGEDAFLAYLCGEWFSAVFGASDGLERGKLTDAAADRAVSAASDTLYLLALNSGSDALGSAVFGFDATARGSRSLLAYIRYYTVKTLVDVSRRVS